MNRYWYTSINKRPCFIPISLVFTEYGFSNPESHAGHCNTFSDPVSSAPLGSDSSSVPVSLLNTSTVLRAQVWHFGECPWVGLCQRIFPLMIRLGLCVYGRKIRRKVPFSGHHIESVHYRHGLSLSMLALITGLGCHLSGFSTVNVLIAYALSALFSLQRSCSVQSTPTEQERDSSPWRAE